MASEKIVEIDEQEIDAIRRGCIHARKLIAASAQALAAIDSRLLATERFLSVMEFRTRHAREVSEDENGVFIEQGS